MPFNIIIHITKKSLFFAFDDTALHRILLLEQVDSNNNEKNRKKNDQRNMKSNLSLVKRLDKYDFVNSIEITIDQDNGEEKKKLKNVIQ